MNAVKMWLIRLRYLNRNYELKRWVGHLEKALQKRMDVMIALPVSGRQKVAENDPVVQVLLKTKKLVDEYVLTWGVKDA